jgi:hypothetical protein
MNNCSTKCSPKNIGKWYDLVIDHLNTTNFVIRPSSGSKAVYDIRLRTNHTLDLPQLAVTKLTSFRLRAEEKLHRIYVQVAKLMYPSSQIDGYIPSLFMSFRLTGGGWEWFCEAETMRLGLCQLDPVPLLSVLLNDSIEVGTNLFKGSCVIPVHLNLTLDTGDLRTHTHAMTVIVNTKCLTLWLFDPQGNLGASSFPSGFKLQHQLDQILDRVCRKLNYKYQGYLTPHCNFQTDNPVFCFIWTSWVELLTILNPWMTPKSMASYLQRRYRNMQRDNSKRDTANTFGHYLREIDLVTI